MLDMLLIAWHGEHHHCTSEQGFKPRSFGAICVSFLHGLWQRRTHAWTGFMHDEVSRDGGSEAYAAQQCGTAK